MLQIRVGKELFEELKAKEEGEYAATSSTMDAAAALVGSSTKAKPSKKSAAVGDLAPAGLGLRAKSSGRMSRRAASEHISFDLAFAVNHFV